MMTSSHKLASRAIVLFVLGMTLLPILPEIGKRIRQPEKHRESLSAYRQHGNYHLGAEYYNISVAVAKGHGFADPFGTESGPTAWMPPLLVGVLSPLVWVFDGDRFYVMLCIVFLKALVLSICGLAVVAIDRESRFQGWLGAAVFAGFLLLESRACFRFTHDGWFILIGITWTVLIMPMLQRNLRKKRLRVWQTVLWGVSGGLIALSSPVAGFAWATSTTIALCRQATIHWFLAGLTSVAVVSPWVIRNQLVFHRFIPVKSNIYFELDQSFALDQDGVLSSFALHPYMGGMERELYVRIGEMKYLDRKKRRFQTQLVEDPIGFIVRVRNRLVATTILPIWFPEYWKQPGWFGLRWLLYPIPFLTVAGLIVFRKRVTDPLKQSVVIVYCAYLFPYVLCSYYPRYGFPLLAIKVLLIYWAVLWFAQRVQKDRHCPDWLQQ